MNARRASAEIKYNGTAITAKLEGQYNEVAYTDPASGEADTVDISIQDKGRKWITAWRPRDGDTMEVKICVHDWGHEGDNQSLDCGSFTLDDYNFSGWPVTGSISGVSVPADTAFRTTERTKTWENITIQEIGREIAKRAGIELVWDVEGQPWPLKCVEQSKQTDCDFLAKICEEYGLAMKVYARKIVIYDREAYKAKDAAVTIGEEEINSWSVGHSMGGTYTGGEFTYTDPATEEEIKVTVGTGPRILKESGKADSKADAERKIKAKIAAANHGADTLSISIAGRTDIMAAICVSIPAIGDMSGKYFLDKVTSRVSSSGGFTMDLEMSLVENMTQEVVLDAINRLEAVGIINAPAYWRDHYKDIAYLDGLILNMATVIKANRGGTNITTVDEALAILGRNGVINTPDYWLGHCTAVTYLDTLIIKAANALGG